MANKTSDKITIQIANGNTVSAQAPVIISASRSTDLPAYYAEWFFNRLKAGYAVWINPYTQQPVYVSFKNTKVIVFWSKNPTPLIPLLKKLDNINGQRYHYYFQFTLNDYEREGFEPNLPPLKKRLEIFKTLSKTIGQDKVIWRFDPLIISPELSPRNLLTRIENIGNQLKGYTDKLVFSFVDISIYRKVQKNLQTFLTQKNIKTQEFNQKQMIETVEGLVAIRERWKSENWNITLGTCAEQIDLKKYGIEHNRCIDPDLMKQIFRNDPELNHYLSWGKLPAFSTPNSLFDNESPGPAVNLKDKGQRLACGCMKSKDIGMYNTCRHYCIYCYANTSKETVEKNLSLYNSENESILKKSNIQV